MRILFIAKNIPVPGKPTNRVVLDIADLLGKRGKKVDVLFPKEWVPFFLRKHHKFRHLYGLTTWNDGSIPITPFPYIRLPLPGRAFLFLERAKNRLRHWSSKRDYDLIHAHYLLPDGAMAQVAGKECKAPVVVTVRSSDVKLLRKAGPGSHTWILASHILHKADQVLTLNGPSADYLIRHFQVESALLPHGIPDQWAFQDDPPEPDVDVVVVAEAIPRKQVHWVIHAFRSLPDMEERKMVIIGDGPVRNEWKAMIDNDPRISLVGRLPHAETMAWLRRSAVFVLPSYQETFGLVYLEAAAAGCALIGMKNEGVEGVFGPEEMAFPVDEQQFYREFHRIVTDVALRQKMGEAARNKARTLGWSQVIDQYEKLYSSL